ncbi:hypothetical protein DFH27DRAFT_52210 [Peziza echinospora]|nr:hypothetical protein DFH27DRAFT_52210 [Peziza echinospora]
MPYASSAMPLIISGPVSTRSREYFVHLAPRSPVFKHSQNISFSSFFLILSSLFLSDRSRYPYIYPSVQLTFVTIFDSFAFLFLCNFPFWNEFLYVYVHIPPFGNSRSSRLRQLGLVFDRSSDIYIYIGTCFPFLLFDLSHFLLSTSMTVCSFLLVSIYIKSFFGVCLLERVDRIGWSWKDEYIYAGS